MNRNGIPRAAKRIRNRINLFARNIQVQDPSIDGFRTSEPHGDHEFLEAGPTTSKPLGYQEVLQRHCEKHFIFDNKNTAAFGDVRTLFERKCQSFPGEHYRQGERAANTLWRKLNANLASRFVWQGRSSDAIQSMWLGGFTAGPPLSTHLSRNRVSAAALSMTPGDIDRPRGRKMPRIWRHWWPTRGRPCRAPRPAGASVGYLRRPAKSGDYPHSGGKAKALSPGFAARKRPANVPF